MPEFVCKHGQSAETAVASLKKILEGEEYSEYTEWKGNSFSVSLGFGMILNLTGKITENEIVIDECSGALSEKVLAECMKLLKEKFTV